MRVVLIAALLVVAACSAGQAQVARPAATPPPGFDTAQRRIDWEAVRRDARERAQETRQSAARAGTEPEARVLSKTQAASAARARLPILLPTLPQRMGTLAAAGESGDLRLVPKENYYVASFELDDASVEIFGTREARILKDTARPFPAAPPKPDAEGFRLRETETGLELSFERYGGAYKITLLCNRPLTDDACRDPERLRTLARSMAYVGGEPEGGADE